MVAVVRKPNSMPHFVVEDFGARPRNRVEPGVHQASDRFPHAQAADFRQVQNLGRGKAVKVQVRIARPDRAQQALVVIHFERGMQPTLHQNPSPTERQRFVNLMKDGLERLDVAFRRTDGAVKSAEGAVFGADVRVVDVAVNLISDDVSGMHPPAHRIGFHSDAH